MSICDLMPLLLPAVGVKIQQNVKESRNGLAVGVASPMQSMGFIQQTSQ